MIALMILAAQDQTFESAEYGIKLKIPAGWNVDATRQARVMLKLNLSGEFPFKPELLVYEIRSVEPITLGQYKEQLRQYVQRAFREPRIMDDRPVEVAGHKGCVLVVDSKGANDAEAVSYKCLVETGPRRLVAVDGVFPKAQEPAMSKVYDDLLASIELMPRKQPAIQDTVKALQEALQKIAANAAPVDQKDELEIYAGDKVIGSYQAAFKSGTRDGAAGLEATLVTKVDLGEDGRAETRIEGFLANDLSVQSVEVTEFKVNREKRAQYFTSRVSLAGGEVKVERRINGERASAQFKVAERTILSELAEPFQFRLLDAAKGLFALPSAAAYENETGVLKLEVGGKQKMKVDDAMQDVYVSFLVREDGALMTYWYDGERRLMRVTVSGQSLVMKRKK